MSTEDNSPDDGVLGNGEHAQKAPPDRPSDMDANDDAPTQLPQESSPASTNDGPEELGHQNGDDITSHAVAMLLAASEATPHANDSANTSLDSAASSTTTPTKEPAYRSSSRKRADSFTRTRSGSLTLSHKSMPLRRDQNKAYLKNATRHAPSPITAEHISHHFKDLSMGSNGSSGGAGMPDSPSVTAPSPSALVTTAAPTIASPRARKGSAGASSGAAEGARARSHSRGTQQDMLQRYGHVQYNAQQQQPMQAQFAQYPSAQQLFQQQQQQLQQLSPSQRAQFYSPQQQQQQQQQLLMQTPPLASDVMGRPRANTLAAMTLSSAMPPMPSLDAASTTSMESGSEFGPLSSRGRQVSRGSSSSSLSKPGSTSALNGRSSTSKARTDTSVDGGGESGSEDDDQAGDDDDASSTTSSRPRRVCHNGLSCALRGRACG